MLQELATRNAIKTKLDECVFDVDSTAWDDLDPEDRWKKIIGCKYWVPFTELQNMIDRNDINNSVYIFVAWGNYGELRNAHPSKQPVKSDNQLIIIMATTNEIDPQGNLMTAEETVFDKLNEMNLNLIYVDAGERFSTIDDRSVTIMTTRYSVRGIKVNS